MGIERCPTIAFRRTLSIGKAVRLHEKELWIEQRTCPHCYKLPLSESTSNPTSFATFSDLYSLQSPMDERRIQNIFRKPCPNCDTRRTEEFERRVGRKPNNEAQY